MATMTKRTTRASAGSNDGRRKHADPGSSSQTTMATGPETWIMQPTGSVRWPPIGLDQAACAAEVEVLNVLLADTITLRDLYQKHHWQVTGPTFYQLHLLFEKHYEAQTELADLLAERIQLLGGISIAMAHDVAETTRVPRPPTGREEVPVQLSRLLRAHEIVIVAAREAARQAAALGDDGTNDLLVSDIVRTNEKQVWFVAEHLVPMALTAEV